MLEHALDYPVVLEPNAGERGAGATIVRKVNALVHALAAARHDLIMQEYVPGVEFGVFYYRYPDAPKGHIFSITDKRFVSGDGHRTLEQLILDDDRAVCQARVHLERPRARGVEPARALELIRSWSRTAAAGETSQPERTDPIAGPEAPQLLDKACSGGLVRDEAFERHP